MHFRRFRDLGAELPRVIFKAPNKDVLLAVEDGINIKDFAEALDVDKSTVSRHVKRLEEQGIVKTTMEGRQKQLYLTFTGKLLQRRM